MEETQPITSTVPEPIRRSVVLLGARIFLVLFIADSIYGLLLAALAFGYIPANLVSSYAVLLWIIHTLKSFLIIYLILYLVLKWISTIYYISEEHLIRQRGVLNIKENLYQLQDIEAVSMNQSWLGRLFNFGDVHITFMIARQKEEVELYATNSPQKYERLFSHYV